MYGPLLLVHILAATIWTGGHIVLSTVVLPGVLRERSPDRLRRFEGAYERIGIPALVVQVATGVELSRLRLGGGGQWFDFGDPISRLISIKLILLAITVAFAVDARFRLMPRLTEKNLVAVAWHVIPVTIISILFVVIGVSFRTGWF